MTNARICVGFAMFSLALTAALADGPAPRPGRGICVAPERKVIIREPHDLAATVSEARGGNICNFINFEGLSDGQAIGTISGNPNVTFGNSWLALWDCDPCAFACPDSECDLFYCDPFFDNCCYDEEFVCSPCAVSCPGGNFANEPSARTVAFFLDPAEPINFGSGVQFVELFYVARSDSIPVTLRAWSGVDGTGSVIATAVGNTVGTNFDGAACNGDPRGGYCLWDNMSLTSATNNIRSITFTGAVQNAFAFDNMTFCVSTPQTGACCRSGGVCDILTAANCSSAGGTYQGNASTCASCAGTNIPPIPVNFPAGDQVTIDAAQGQILNRVVSFLSPESNQVTTVSVTDVNNAGARGLTIMNTPGNVAIISLNWTPRCTDVGTYFINFVAVDNFNPPGVTPKSLRINVICSCQQPTVTQQPQSQTVCEGQSVTFNVTASGSAPLTYQWQKDGSNIGGETGTSLTINPVTAASAGTYRVNITNSCGTVTSTTVTLTVNTAPVITQQPTNLSVCEGSPANFTVAASGAGTLTYQWRHNGSDMAGRTASNLNINPVTAGDAGTYQVIVTNACGSTASQQVTLTVNTAPVITQQPQDQGICGGSSATFSVTATGTQPITYQWQKDGSDIPGATGSSLVISPVTGADAGMYRVVVTNECGSVTSNAARLDFGSLPVITQHPASQIICAGGRLTFNVSATGTPAPRYQWRNTGVGIPGATGNTYIIDPAADIHSGTYDVEVSNACGSVISDAATAIAWPTSTGDANGDGVLNGQDIATFVFVILTSPNGPANLDFCGVDMNADGIVNLADMNLLLPRLLGN